MILTLREAGIRLARLFYPRLCAGCGQDLPEGGPPVCSRCVHQLPETFFESQVDNPVERIFWGRLPLQAASAHLYFSKSSRLQRLMHQFKYRGRKDIGLFLGRRMGASLFASGRFSGLDAVVPLPLARAREKMRGYNQAAVLCEGIAQTLAIPIRNDLLSRPRSTSSQTKKNRVERWQNMQGKFICHPERLSGNAHILLVDDVITTGATLEAAGEALQQIPGLTISIASLAYTST